MTTPPALTRQNLSLARIVAQRLVGDGFATPVEAVAHLGAVQAQDLPGALASVALRMESPDTTSAETDVRDALIDGSIVRSWPMRGTLHLTRAADIGWICDLTRARGERQAASRHRELGIDDALATRAEEVITEVLGAGSLTRTELQNRLQGSEFTAVPQRLIHLLSLLSLRGVLVQSGPLKGNQPVFRPARDWITDPAVPADRDEALRWITARYFLGHGPATLKDLARWTGLTLTELKPAVAALEGTVLARTEIDTADAGAVPHWHDPALPDLLATHRRAARGTLRLPGFDELVLGYADRSCTVRPEHARAIVPGGNGMFKATVIEDGVATATWQRSRPAELVPLPAIG